MGRIISSFFKSNNRQSKGDGRPLQEQKPFDWIADGFSSISSLAIEPTGVRNFASL